MVYNPAQSIIILILTIVKTFIASNLPETFCNRFFI